MASRTAVNDFRTTEITEVKIENPSVKTFTFKDKECGRAKPGQFLMLWIPGVDEIPFSILDADRDGTTSITVKRVGDATRALHEKKVGDFVGVRGPFGNSFHKVKGRALMVGGGTGIAPLLFLARKLRSESAKMTFVLGAKTKDELLFMDELHKMHRTGMIELTMSTEDGSCGLRGLCTEPLEEMLTRRTFDIVYACGPELMISKVSNLAQKHGINIEASLERLMRCAIGLCGSCVIGKYRVCTDGPVFNGRQLREMRSELGVSKRDFDGKNISLR